MDARTPTTKTNRVDVQATALATVRRERHRPGGRPAFLMALHDLYRYYAAAARRRRVVDIVGSKTGGGGGEEEDDDDESDSGDGYDSFGEMCTRELSMDRRTVRMTIKEALIGDLFCAMVAGHFDDRSSVIDNGGGGDNNNNKDDKGAAMRAIPDDDKAATRAALRRRREADRIAVVASSSYRCVVGLFTEWQGRDDWIDTSREALAAWFAAPARRGLRDLFASIWTRVKALAGPGVRPTRQHFAAAYNQERTASSSLPPASSASSLSSSSLSSSSPSTLGKRKRQAVSSPSVRARIACTPYSDGDGGSAGDHDDKEGDNCEVGRNRATKSRPDRGNDNEMEEKEEEDDDDESIITDDEEDDDSDDEDEDDNGGFMSPAEVCGIGLAGRPSPTTAAPCFGAQSSAASIPCPLGAESIVVTDALGRQYTLTPMTPLPAPLAPSRAPHEVSGLPSRASCGASTMAPSVLAPAAMTTSTTSVTSAMAAAMTAPVMPATYVGQNARSPHQHQQVASSSLSTEEQEEDTEALRLEAGLAQCVRALQKECAAAASDARSGDVIDRGRQQPTTTTTTVSTTTTTTAATTAKRDLFDAISVCMRYVVDKTLASDGQCTRTAADWLMASCREDAPPAGPASSEASEMERRHRRHARRMLVGCLRAMAMVGDPCFSMAVVASVGDALAQRSTTATTTPAATTPPGAAQQQQQQQTPTSSLPEQAQSNARPGNKETTTTTAMMEEEATRTNAH
jgi:hypothetical protein